MDIQYFFLFVALLINIFFLVTVYEISSRKNIDGLLIFLSMIVVLVPPISYMINSTSEYIFKFFQPLLFYLYFRRNHKYSKSLALFFSIFLLDSVETPRTFLEVFISSLTGDRYYYDNSGAIIFVLSIISMIGLCSIFKYFKFDLLYFKRPIFNDFIKKINYALVGVYILLRFSDILSLIAHFNSSASILTTISFLVFLSIMTYIYSFREKYEKEEEIKRKIREQKLFQKYTDEIVSLYNEIRGFRHDYAGMLVSLKSSIDTGDINNVQRIYDNVLATANLSLRSDKYTYFDINNVGDPAFRSVLTETMLKAKENDVDVTFEIKEYIERVDLPLLELVRLTSVLLNNAIEGAIESYYKKLNISLVKLDSSVVFVVQNSRKKGDIDLHQIFERGFSTKGFNRGIGLSNVKEIIDNHPNLILETEISDDNFTQIVTFNRK